ncbi:MAG: hypothetical protein HWD60_13295 [Defluviicoccus sp.]|nr:MAG: hypothetical protein HWD60_13295 [Defluviicoccus sp.]
MSTGDGAMMPMRQLQREMLQTERAMYDAGAGAGAIGTLECRLADLQGRLLTTGARSLDDVTAKLEVARSLVEGLGPRGYLLDLIDAILADICSLRSEDPPAP